MFRSEIVFIRWRKFSRLLVLYQHPKDLLACIRGVDTSFAQLSLPSLCHSHNNPTLRPDDRPQLRNLNNFFSSQTWLSPWSPGSHHTDTDRWANTFTSTIDQLPGFVLGLRKTDTDMDPQCNLVLPYRLCFDLSTARACSNLLGQPRHVTSLWCILRKQGLVMTLHI